MPQSSAKLKARAEPDREFLDQVPEIFIFSNCLGIVQELGNLEIKFKAGRMQRPLCIKRATALLLELTRMATVTERFDILMSVKGAGQFSPSFWKWFNWWNDYRRTLTWSQIDRIERLGKAGDRGVNDYRPAGDWLNYRQTPALAFQVAD